MKDLITSIASLLILMMFVMQFTANQVTYSKVAAAENAVREFRVISENQDIIKSEDVEELKNKLAEVLDCSKSEIVINISGNIAGSSNTGDEAVSSAVEIKMPVYGIIGPAAALGISSAENMRIHTATTCIILEPEPETEPGSPEPETEPAP